MLAGSKRELLVIVLIIFGLGGACCRVYDCVDARLDVDVQWKEPP
jgi:hypothetical protein